MRALIVDDSGTVRKFIRMGLKTCGITDCAEAEDGQQALDSLAADPNIDLMLVDWNMPVMDGLTLVKAVRADAQYEKIRIVMVTTEGEFSKVLEAIGAGANEYLMKPFAPEALQEKLKLVGVLEA